MRVLIVGGGIAGLGLAVALERVDIEVVVVELSPALRGAGYMIDFFGAGVDAAEELGLLAALERIHFPIPELAFVDESGAETLSLDYATLRRRLFHDRHFNFLRGDLEQVLFDRLAGRVPVRFGATVDAIEPAGERVDARLSDGSRESFDLLVGADGVHSRVRALAFGSEKAFTRRLGFHTAAFVLDRCPDSLADRTRFVTLTGIGRQLSVYPIRGERLATFFIHEAAGREVPRDRQSQIAELRAVFGDLGWLVPDVLAAGEDATSIYFDEVTQIEIERWYRSRVVLLGDACQCVSLLAGQGASMAMAAACVLARELAATPDDVAAGLARYAARLQPAIHRKQAAGRRVARWFVPRSRFARSVRDLGLRMSTWPLTSAFIRRRFAADSDLGIREHDH